MVLCGALGRCTALLKAPGHLHGVQLVVVQVAPEGNGLLSIQHINTVDSDGAVQLHQDKDIISN